METATLFLCGDLMLGRGIDQILPHPCEPALHEPLVKTASAYVELAEEASGTIPRPVSFDYVWGEALAALAAERPLLRIANLESAITRSDSWWRGKAIHYRLSPENAMVLSAAGIDACTLANNHLLDWGCAGLVETVTTLRRLGIAAVGAGRDLGEAETPAVFPLQEGRRVLLFAWGVGSSGIPPEWGAAADRPGVNRLSDLSMEAVRRIARQVGAAKRESDLAIASLHWGGNWGYAISSEERRFAHALVDQAGIDLVHGHSSHHVKGIEVYRGRLILYGCGDLLTDYEGISGYEAFRGDLSLLYFPTLAADGSLVRLRMLPTRVRRLQVTRATLEESLWLRDLLNKEGEELGTRADLARDGSLELRWDNPGH